jgi:hypothetical protein
VLRQPADDHPSPPDIAALLTDRTSAGGEVMHPFRSIEGVVTTAPPV